MNHGRAPGTACTVLLYCDIFGNAVVGWICPLALLGMFSFVTAKVHNRPRAISKIMKWVQIIVLLIVLCLQKGGVLVQFLWPKWLLSLRAIVRGVKIKSRCTRAAQVPPPSPCMGFSYQ